MRTLITLTFSISLFGCTTWGTTTSLGPTKEVARRAKGMPSFATSSSTSVAGGFVGMSAGPLVAGGFGAGTESHTRTRCVQDVEIAYEQPYEIHPYVMNRSKDRIASIALVAGGALMILAGIDAANDPYSEASPTAGYVIGGGLVAGGVGLYVYSHTSLPREPKPAVTSGVNRWVATQTVEAEGCTPPPSTPASVIVQTAPTSVIVQPAPSTPSPDTAERLRTLDKLKASGTISDAEYKRKRAQIVEGL